jgi:hypothetical protein
VTSTPADGRVGARWGARATIGAASGTGQRGRGTGIRGAAQATGDGTLTGTGDPRRGHPGGAAQATGDGTLTGTGDRRRGGGAGSAYGPEAA